MTVRIEKLRNFVSGSWVDAIDGRVATIVNPATGAPIAEAPACTAADVDRAVDAARRGLPGWLETTPRERSELLLKLADRVDQHAHTLALLESQNVGKPLKVARDEIPVCVDNLRFFAAAARCLDGTPAGEYLRGYTSMMRREPLGIVGQIAPWNYPLMTAIWKVAPALAAGNVVVLKPSEQTPVSTLYLAGLAADLLPPGVLNVITGDGDPVGAAIVRHRDVQMVSLTGDISTGKTVSQVAAATLKRVHLELGGKAPVIVFDDADLDAVKRAIVTAGYLNSGQDCAAASRIIAGPRIYERLLADLVPAVEAIVVGDPAEGEHIEVGPVISGRHQKRVQGFLERAQDTKARILTGGDAAGRTAGFFIRPAVVAGVDQQHEMVQQEVFGPVVTVQRFTDEDEALAWANDVRYGLVASVWTRDVGRALAAVRRLQFGTVWVNDHMPLVSEMPFGGYKQSGHGRDLSMYSVEEYTQLKHVMIKLG